jgi:hypothetical protein
MIASVRIRHQLARILVPLLQPIAMEMAKVVRRARVRVLRLLVRPALVMIEVSLGRGLFTIFFFFL